jgi:hypothetical protein
MTRGQILKKKKRKILQLLITTPIGGTLHGEKFPFLNQIPFLFFLRKKIQLEVAYNMTKLDFFIKIDGFDMYI